MRNTSLLILTALLILSCSDQKFKAKIKANVSGLHRGELVIKVLELNNQRAVDTIKTDKKGNFEYTVRKKAVEADFYYLYYKETRIASLFVQNEDRITLYTDTLGSDLTIKGSEESELLLNLERGLGKSQMTFDSLRNELVNTVYAREEAKRLELNYALGAVYIKQKQSAIKHIYNNPYSITNLVLLYYKFNEELPLFADSQDILLFRKVHDSLLLRYPTSIYLKRLKSEISDFDKLEALKLKLAGASESGFPDLKLPDNKAEVKTLSHLQGKVILLSFWSIKDAAQKMLNIDYLSLYNKYNSKGFEIYQVSLDTDKTSWARAVADQKLPWINVCDGLGSNSYSVRSYNIQKLPANFIIDREGTIIARDLYDAELEKKLASLMK